MTNWICKIDILQYLNNNTEETPESVLKCAEHIKAEIDASHYARRVFLNAPHKMVEAVKKAVDAGMDYDECCDILNGKLSRIYDIADAERVWISG